MHLILQIPTEPAVQNEEHQIELAKGGDTAAFARLYDANLDRIFRYFYYRLGHRHDAEDLTEMVFLKAWQNIAGYDLRGIPFLAWLYRIAHNLLIDHRRSTRPSESWDEDLELVDHTAGPEDIAARRDEARLLANAVAQLSPLEQTVVVLRFVEGLDHATVARIIDKSAVATRSIQSRALDRLGRLLEQPERNLK